MILGLVLLLYLDYNAIGLTGIYLRLLN